MVRKAERSSSTDPLCTASSEPQPHMRSAQGLPCRQHYEVCFGGKGLSAKLGATTSAQQRAAGAHSLLSLFPRVPLCCPPTACSRIQQDKRALSPGSSWPSYFSFRPHFLELVQLSRARQVMTYKMHFSEVPGQSQIYLCNCAEKNVEANQKKLGSCWTGIGVCLGNCLLFTWALLPILEKNRASLDLRNVGRRRL